MYVKQNITKNFNTYGIKILKQVTDISIDLATEILHLTLLFYILRKIDHLTLVWRMVKDKLNNNLTDLGANIKN